MTSVTNNSDESTGKVIDDGGPAIPCGSYDPTTACEQPPVIPGISKRDYFAAHAPGCPVGLGAFDVADMLGIEVPKQASSRTWFIWWRNANALWKLADADAMLAASKGESNAK